MTTMNRAPWKCRICRQLRKSSAMYCSVCQQPWQNVIDQSYVHGSKQPAQTDQGQYQQSPWQQHQQQDWQAHWQSTSSRGRTPSPRQRQRPKSVKGNKTPKQDQPKADAGSAYDDAGCSYGQVPQMPIMFPQQAMQYPIYARDNASIAPARGSMATACESQFGENACSSSCCTTSDGYAFYPHDANYASTAYAKAAGDIDDIKLRHRRRGQRLMTMMRGRQAELPEDMQKKVQKVLTKFWAANLHRFACSGYSVGHCETELRRGGSRPKSTP